MYHKRMQFEYNNALYTALVSASGSANVLNVKIAAMSLYAECI
jgi:hypothetical protein